MSMGTGKKGSSVTHRILVGNIPPAEDTEPEIGEMIQDLVNDAGALERRAEAFLKCAQDGLLEKETKKNLEDVRKIVRNLRALRTAAERLPRG
jgi:hypothetical protein